MSNVRDAIRAFHSASKTGEQVARLIDLGYALGFERSGVAAAVVKAHGHGKEVVDALMQAAQHADGDPWEYVIGVFKREKANGRTGSGGWKSVEGQTSGLPAGYGPPTKDELATFARNNAARNAARGSGGSRDDTQPDTGAVLGQDRKPVQQPGAGAVDA